MKVSHSRVRYFVFVVFLSHTDGIAENKKMCSTYRKTELRVRLIMMRASFRILCGDIDIAIRRVRAVDAAAGRAPRRDGAGRGGAGGRHGVSPGTRRSQQGVSTHGRARVQHDVAPRRAGARQGPRQAGRHTRTESMKNAVAMQAGMKNSAEHRRDRENQRIRCSCLQTAGKRDVMPATCGVPKRSPI